MKVSFLILALSVKKEYRTEIDDPPILPCENCGQETHLECLRNILGNPEKLTRDAVKKLVNPFNLPGWSYNCLHCKQKLLPSPDADVKVSVMNIEKKKKQKTLANQQEQSSTNSLMIADGNSDEPSAEDTEAEVEPQSSPTSSSQNEVRSEIIENSPGVENSILMVETPQPIAETTPQNTRSPPSHPSSFPNICQDYLKASCTKGQSCELNHPEVCPNLLDHGLKPPYGCNGKECHDLHPPLCKNSFRAKWIF